MAALLLTYAQVAAAKEVLSVCMAERSEQAGLDHYTNVVIPAFQARYPNVEVDFQLCGWGIDAIVTRYIGGKAPDVYQLGGDNLGSYLQMIMPLDRFVQGWEDLKDFPKGMLDGLSLNGKLLAIPFSMTTRSLTYRTDHFDTAGLARSQVPTTWDELVQAARKLTRFDSAGNMLVQGFRTTNHWLEHAALLFQAGGNYMDPALTRFTFADAAGKEAVTFAQRLIKEWRVTSPGILGGLDKGEAAMEYRTAGILQAPVVGELVDVVEPTRHKRQAQIIEPNAWVITNTSKLQQEAWNWIAFVSQLDTMLAISRLARTLPPRVRSMFHPPWSEDRRLVKHFENTTFSVTVPQQAPLMNRVRREYIQPTLAKVLYQDEPVTVYEDAQRQANALLQAEAGK